jgi:hypothetical protein
MGFSEQESEQFLAKASNDGVSSDQDMDVLLTDMETALGNTKAHTSAERERAGQLASEARSKPEIKQREMEARGAPRQESKTIPPDSQTPQAPGADIAGAAQQKAREGSVRLGPLPEIGRWARRMFGHTGGLPEDIHAIAKQRERDLEAVGSDQRANRNEIERTIKALRTRRSRQDLQNDIGAFFDGKKSADDLARDWGVSRRDRLVTNLERQQQANQAASAKIATWKGLTEEDRVKIAQNTSYQTRGYLKWILGDEYEPPKTAYRDAVLEVEAGLQDDLDTMFRRATAVRGKRGGVDVVQYMQTGDDTLLAGIGKRRASLARGVREEYLRLQDTIDNLAVTGNTVGATRNADALNRAASDIVDYYLHRDKAGLSSRGGTDIGHLAHRYMEGAFRALYGEVTDPAARQALTTEVQGKMLANMTFFNRVLDAGKGTVWSRRPDGDRFSTRLGDENNAMDRKRYGDMAGKYVTKEFMDLIDTGRGHSTAGKALYYTPLSVQRSMKLMNPRTWFRNYATAVTGFSLGNGDVGLKTWKNRFAEGHKLAARYAAGDPAALREVSELMRLGVFRPGSSTSVQDIDAALGGALPKAKKIMKGSAAAYATIDLPSKYAAFKANMDAGMSAEAAAEHVQRFYQNRERSPQWIQGVSKMPLADYVGYTYDSMRIRVNQARYAAEQAQAGNFRPLVGFVASMGITALQAGLLKEQVLDPAAAKLHQAMRRVFGGDPKRPVDVLDTEQVEDLRPVLPEWDRGTAVVTWKERAPVGQMTLFYTALGGNSAWPVEDWIAGAAQSSDDGASFLKALAGNARQNLDAGMYVDMVSKFWTGETTTGWRSPTGKGLMHVMPGREEPRRGRIIANAMGEMALDMTVGGISKPLRDLLKERQAELAGQETNVGMYANTRTKEDITASAFRLVRTYRIEKTDMNRNLRNRASQFAVNVGEAKRMVSREYEETVTKGASTQDQRDEALEGRTIRLNQLKRIRDMFDRARRLAPEWYGDEKGRALLIQIGKDIGLDRYEQGYVAGYLDDVPAYDPRPDISGYDVGDWNH